ncbi:MAG: NUDIX hydrolase [Paludibacteraceae bacterium]|nr:NUDIX hydrolase [Paludibacteraceae bacterium]
MYTYEHPHPSVTTDCVVFGFDGESLNLLLIERGIEPYKGTWALPGGFVRMNETAEEGALRELQEETGVEDIYVEQFHTFTAVDRDPRERVMTIAFLAFVRQEKYSVIAGDDAVQAKWFPVKDLPELAFDHQEIIRMALDKLRWKIMYEPLVFHLLNKSFTMTQLLTIYEVVLGHELDRRNFHKKMLTLGYVVPTKERVRSVGRPGTLYAFDEEKYKEQIWNRNVF